MFAPGGSLALFLSIGFANEPRLDLIIDLPPERPASATISTEIDSIEPSLIQQPAPAWIYPRWMWSRDSASAKRENVSGRRLFISRVPEPSGERQPIETNLADGAIILGEPDR